MSVSFCTKYAQASLRRRVFTWSLVAPPRWRHHLQSPPDWHKRRTLNGWFSCGGLTLIITTTYSRYDDQPWPTRWQLSADRDDVVHLALTGRVGLTIRQRHVTLHGLCPSGPCKKRTRWRWFYIPGVAFFRFKNRRAIGHTHIVCLFVSIFVVHLLGFMCDFQSILDVNKTEKQCWIAYI